MVVQLDDIYALSWEKGIPDVGGNDDESNLTIIVKESIRCQNQTTLTCLKRKITLYLSQGVDNLERLESACRTLIGIKVRFKDGVVYVSLVQIHNILKIAPKFSYAYAKNRLAFPELTKEGFKDFLEIMDGGDEISLESLIEIYLTFETMKRVRDTLEKALQKTTPRKLACLYFNLKNDPYFKSKIHHQVCQLTISDYIEFIAELKPENIRWINYECNTKVDSLADLTKNHDSAVVNLNSEFFALIKNKRRMVLKCYDVFTSRDVYVLRKNNPDLRELTLVRSFSGQGLMPLITSSLTSLTLEECSLSLEEWKYLSQTLFNVDLTLKRMHVFQEVLEPLYPRLRSLTLENHVLINFTNVVPVKSLSLTNQIDFGPQPHVRSLTLDCLNYFSNFHKVLVNFPFLHTFAFSSPNQTSIAIDQDFFINLHKSSPLLYKLVLNGVKWGKFPYLRTKFLNLIQLDISRTYFFESNPEELLNKLCFMFPNLKRIIFSAEDAIHHEPLIASLRDHFPSLKFTEKKSG